MPAVDVRQGLVQVLGIPIQAFDGEFIHRLEEISTRPNFRLSNGARLLQGIVMQETPLGDQLYTVQRIRAICAFIGAMEILGQEVYQDETNRPNRTKQVGKDNGS